MRAQGETLVQQQPLFCSKRRTGLIDKTDPHKQLPGFKKITAFRGRFFMSQMHDKHPFLTEKFANLKQICKLVS